VKKFAAISLLILLLFNFIGYRLVFYALQQNAEKNIVARIDKENYNDVDLVTLTVPLSMPYLQDSKDFERKDGEITISGKIYHYVKQKISRVTWYYCVCPMIRKRILRMLRMIFTGWQTNYRTILPRLKNQVKTAR
jgi:hypothetical protein